MAYNNIQSCQHSRLRFLYDYTTVYSALSFAYHTPVFSHDLKSISRQQAGV